MARVALPLTVVDTAGNAVQGASVTIRKRSDNSVATLYTSETGGVTTGNPATTNTQGRLPYWIDRGAYAAAVTGTGITPYTENFEAAPAKDAGVDTTWGSLLAGGFTSGTLAARPATPTTTKDQYFATDDWGGTLYAALANLSGWTPVASKNQQVLNLSAAASGTFSGLLGETELAYTLDIAVVLSSAAGVILQFNGDGAANYGYEVVYGQAATPTAANSGNTGAVISIAHASSASTVARAVIHAKSGTNRYVQSSYGESSFGVGTVSSYWNNTASALASIAVVATAGTMTGVAVLRRLATP